MKVKNNFVRTIRRMNTLFDFLCKIFKTPSKIFARTDFVFMFLQEKMLIKNKQLSRWICLKLIDGDKKILKSIEKNLKINLLNNKEIKTELEEIKDILNFNGIKQEEVKNSMISSIIFKAENVYKDTVDIKKENTKSIKIIYYPFYVCLFF